MVLLICVGIWFEIWVGWRSNIAQICWKYSLFNCAWFPHSKSKSNPIIDPKTTKEKKKNYLNTNNITKQYDTAAKHAEQQQRNHESTLTAKAVVYYQRMIPLVACK